MLRGCRSVGDAVQVSETSRPIYSSIRMILMSRFVVAAYHEFDENHQPTTIRAEDANMAGRIVKDNILSTGLG